MAEQAKTFKIENARLIFKNFAGNEGKFNIKGDRNFCVVLPLDAAEDLLRDGWNVKYLEAREEGDEIIAYIKVSVSYKYRPPRAVMITSTARTSLDESMLETLDWANIQFADVICRGSYWESPTGSGIKAYLQTMFATVEEDELERKYAINEPRE